MSKTKVKQQESTTIRNLYMSGFNVTEIAGITNIAEEEVQHYLDMMIWTQPIDSLQERKDRIAELDATQKARIAAGTIPIIPVQKKSYHVDPLMLIICLLVLVFIVLFIASRV